MKTTLFALVALAVGSAALAVPVPPHPVVNPTEPTVVVPGLEFVGASRISSVRFCVQQTGAKDWHNLITDSELESMHKCLVDLT